MSVIDMHAVAAHRELNLVDDALPGGFDAEHFTRLKNVVGRSGPEVNSRSSHDVLQPVAFNQKVVP